MEAGTQAVRFDADLQEAACLGDVGGADGGAGGVLQLDLGATGGRGFAVPASAAVAAAVTALGAYRGGELVHTGGVVPWTSLDSWLFVQAVRPKTAIASTGVTVRQDGRRVVDGAIGELLYEYRVYE